MYFKISFSAVWGVKSIKLTKTCVGFQVLGRYHDHEADGPFIAKHFVGPAADRAHTLDCSYSIVGYQHLEQKQKQPQQRQFLKDVIKKQKGGILILTFSMTRLPPNLVTNSAGEATVKSL